MKQKQYLLLAVLAFIGGIIGGTLSGKISVNEGAYAVGKPSKAIEAEKFRLVGKDGGLLGEWKSDTDSNGNPEVTLWLGKIGPHFGLVSIETSKFSSGIEVYGDQSILFIRAFKKSSWIRMQGPSQPLYSEKRLLGESSYIELKAGSGTELPSLALGKGDIGLERTRAVLGHTRLTDKTGSTITRPPSSLVLFDKDGHVKWRAP